MNNADAGYYILRAQRAYLRSTPYQYSNGYVDHHEGRGYVVLVNSYRTLAVYRITNDGALRRLKRWPRDIDENAEPVAHATEA